MSISNRDGTHDGLYDEAWERENMAKIRWRSRRGLLELDVIFTHFLQHGGFLGLTNPQKEAFARLLEKEDPDIYSWILGEKAVPDPQLNE